MNVYVCEYDADNNLVQAAAPVESTISVDENGIFTLSNFLDSGNPVSFKFPTPNIGEYAPIEFVGNIDRSDDYPNTPYLLDNDGEYMECYLWDYNDSGDWTNIWYPYVYEGDQYCYVYRYDKSDPENEHEYYGYITVTGTLDDGSYGPWLYLYFYFDGPATQEAAKEYYLIGNFNGWTLADANCKFEYDAEKDEYVLDYKGELTSGFKINDGTWDDDNANWGGEETLVLGETYTLTAAGNSGNISLNQNVSNPHIVFNPSAGTLLITGEEIPDDPSVTKDYYLIGNFNNWTLSDPACKFSKVSDNEYVLDVEGTLTSGFKFNDGTWSDDKANWGGTETLVLGEVYTLTVGGSSKDITLAEPVENPHLIFDPIAGTVVITANSGVNMISVDGNAPVEYFNINGQRVENPTNGIFVRKQGSKVSKVIVR